MGTKLREVLVVDDDLVTLYLNQRVIEQMGIAQTITLKDKGRDALDYLRDKCFKEQELLNDECPQLILLDIHMPDTDGFELLALLEQLDHRYLQRHRVILLTTSTHEKDVEKAQRFALNGYIVKPLTAKKLGLLLGNA